MVAWTHSSEITAEHALRRPRRRGLRELWQSWIGLQKACPLMIIQSFRHNAAQVVVSLHCLHISFLMAGRERDELEFDLQGLLDAIREESEDVFAYAAGDHGLRRCGGGIRRCRCRGENP